MRHFQMEFQAREHQEELLREARERRLARAVRSARGEETCRLANAARAASFAFCGASQNTRLASQASRRIEERQQARPGAEELLAPHNRERFGLACLR